MWDSISHQTQFKGALKSRLHVPCPSPSPSPKLHCVNGSEHLMDRMGSAAIQSVKRSLSIGTMIQFDGDGDGDGTDLHIKEIN